jgi:hypothetical protein
MAVVVKVTNPLPNKASIQIKKQHTSVSPNTKTNFKKAIFKPTKKATKIAVITYKNMQVIHK